LPRLDDRYLLSNNVIFMLKMQSLFFFISVDNPAHSDFTKLRNMLISTHMHDLKEVTEDVHYENFRTQLISKISQQAFKDRGYRLRNIVIQFFIDL